MGAGGEGSLEAEVEHVLGGQIPGLLNAYPGVAVPSVEGTKDQGFDTIQTHK